MRRDAYLALVSDSYLPEWLFVAWVEGSFWTVASETFNKEVFFLKAQANMQITLGSL